jgi:hypothetical protein
MDWATYLARGVPSAEKVAEKRQQTIMKYVEDYFRQEGASRFSSKIAVGFLQVSKAP